MAEEGTSEMQQSREFESSGQPAGQDSMLFPGIVAPVAAGSEVSVDLRAEYPCDQRYTGTEVFRKSASERIEPGKEGQIACDCARGLT